LPARSASLRQHPDFAGNHIAGHLRKLPGITVTKSVGLRDPQHGLGGDTLDTDDEDRECSRSGAAYANANLSFRLRIR